MHFEIARVVPYSAATALFILLISLVRRHASKGASGTPPASCDAACSDPASDAACAFEQHVRRVHASSTHARAPCVLDVCPALGMHFAIGSFDLVQADLQAALPPQVATAVLDSLVAAGLVRTFGLRRELVNFKKACWLVLQDVQRLERSMVRQASFFSSELPRCKTEGHECADCWRWRRARQRDLAFCRRADGEEARSPEGARDQNMYLQIIERVHKVKGMRLALVDLRSILKQLCLLPRHPDDAHRMPKPLLDVPGAFFAAAAIARAEADAPVRRTADSAECR